MCYPTTTLVTDALRNVLVDMWYEQNRYRDIDRHQEEFRKFCEDKFTALFKNLSEIS